MALNLGLAPIDVNVWGGLYARYTGDNLLLGRDSP
jgi:hypothetical protein